MSSPARNEARLRFFLRDFRVLEGLVGLGPGSSLIALLASRKGYVSLTDARWSGTADAVPHLVLRVDQVLWASAPAADVPLVNAHLATETTSTDLQIEGGILIRGRLPLAPHQRLGDYLDFAGPFIPLQHAVMLRSRQSGKPMEAALGDVVVSQSAIEAAWESSSPAASNDGSPAESNPTPIA